MSVPVQRDFFWEGLATLSLFFSRLSYSLQLVVFQCHFDYPEVHCEVPKTSEPKGKLPGQSKDNSGQSKCNLEHNSTAVRFRAFVFLEKEALELSKF